jgi:hypothetical protein
MGRCFDATAECPLKCGMGLLCSIPIQEIDVANTSTLEESPLTGKQRFERRTFKNWLITFAVFIVVVTPVAFISTELTLAVAVLAGAGVYYVHFYRLERRPVGIRCPHCSGYVLTNTFWKCGFKQCINENTDKFPFVNRCEHCGNEPKAYQCHHCNEPIFLTDDKDKLNYASRVDAESQKPRVPTKAPVSAPVAPKPETEEEIHSKKKREIQRETELAHERRLRNLEVGEERLAEMAAKGPEEKSLVEEFEEALKEEKSFLRLGEARARERLEAEKLPSPQREKRLEMIENAYTALIAKYGLK